MDLQDTWRYKRADRKKDDRKKRELEAAAINRACGRDARRLHKEMMSAREAARPAGRPPSGSGPFSGSSGRKRRTGVSSKSRNENGHESGSAPPPARRPSGGGRETRDMVEIDEPASREAALGWAREETARRRREESGDRPVELKPPEAFSDEYSPVERLTRVRPGGSDAARAGGGHSPASRPRPEPASAASRRAPRSADSSRPDHPSARRRGGPRRGHREPRRRGR